MGSASTVTRVHEEVVDVHRRSADEFTVRLAAEGASAPRRLSATG